MHKTNVGEREKRAFSLREVDPQPRRAFCMGATRGLISPRDRPPFPPESPKNYFVDCAFFGGECLISGPCISPGRKPHSKSPSGNWPKRRAAPLYDEARCQDYAAPRSGEKAPPFLGPSVDRSGIVHLIRVAARFPTFAASLVGLGAPPAPSFGPMAFGRSVPNTGESRFRDIRGRFGRFWLGIRGRGCSKSRPPSSSTVGFQASPSWGFGRYSAPRTNDTDKEKGIMGIRYP